MIKSPTLGYVFEGRYDSKKRVGILGSYKVTYKGDIANVNITGFQSFEGKLIVPAIADVLEGFKPFYMFLSEDNFDKDVDKFVKSNKPIFGIMSEFALICNLKLKFNIATGELLDDSEYTFYTPRCIISLNEDGREIPALSCDRLVDGPTNENMFLLGGFGILMKGYIEQIKKQLNSENCKDRLSYMKFLACQKDVVL